jgi:hypothetical protein
LPQIAVDRGTFDAEAAGNGGFGIARLDGSKDPLAQVRGICFHDLHDTTVAMILQSALKPAATGSMLPQNAIGK